MWLQATNLNGWPPQKHCARFLKASGSPEARWSGIYNDHLSLHVLGVEGANVWVLARSIEGDGNYLARLDHMVRIILHFDGMRKVVIVSPCDRRPGGHLDDGRIELIAG